MFSPKEAIFCLAVLAFAAGSLVDLTELLQGRQPSASRKLPFAFSVLQYNALFDRPAYFALHEITLESPGEIEAASVWAIPGHYNRELFTHRWSYPGSRLPELLLRHFYCETDPGLMAAKWVVRVPGEEKPAFTDEVICQRQ